MKEVTSNVSMDNTIKTEFDYFCEKVGMDANTAFNMFARAVLRERKLPFEVRLDDGDHYYDD